MSSYQNTMNTASKANPQVKKRSQLRAVLFRFKKNKAAMFGAILLVLILLLCFGAPLLVSYQDAVTQKMSERLLSPSKEHIFGTDRYGRDLFARVLYGGRISISVAFATIVLSLSVGIILGAVAGYYGGMVDNIIMRVCDVFLAIPQMLMAISIVAAMGPGLFNLLLAMSISLVPRFARIVKSSILGIKDSEFVDAAITYGSSNVYIIRKHIIPNAIGPIIVQATLNIAETIISISGLSFLGLGVKAPMPEWGALLSEGREFMRGNAYLVLIPGIAIVLTVMAFNLMGDGLRDALDPKMKN